MNAVLEERCRRIGADVAAQARAAQVQTQVARPVVLAVNNSGAWKTVIRFDAGDDLASARVQVHAEELGHIDPAITWRIATAEPLPCVLMYWDAERGWRKA